jgi:DNA end-binding protein Ku
MALRSIWRGHLRLALVACPVALYSTRHDRDTIKFNMINPETGNRIKMVSQDAETNEEIARSETVKGFEFKKNTYLIVTPEDMESIKVDSSSIMTIEKFIGADAIDPLHYDSSYYVAPDGKDANDIYATLRAAIAATGRVAMTRVVIQGRERTVALRVVAKGIMAHTLLEERDLNDPTDLFPDLTNVTVDPAMVQLATQLVDRQSGTYDASDLEDRYETRLRVMIAAKLKAAGVEDATVPWIVKLNGIDWKEMIQKSVGPTVVDLAAPAAAPAGKSKRKKEKASVSISST